MSQKGTFFLFYSSFFRSFFVLVKKKKKPLFECLIGLPTGSDTQLARAILVTHHLAFNAQEYLGLVYPAYFFNFLSLRDYFGLDPLHF